MPEITLDGNDIYNNVSDAAKSVVPHVPDGEEWDLLGGLEKIDRVAKNILELISKFQELSPTLGGGAGARNMLDSSVPRASMNREDHFAKKDANKRLASENSPVNDERNKALIEVKTLLKNHVATCAQENPEMPLEEVLSRAKITAGQLLMIMQLMGW